MTLRADDIQIASTMVSLIQQSAQPGLQPIPAFIYYWVAFTSIYKTLARRAGLRPQFGLRKNGTLRTRRVGNVKMAEIDAPPEDRQINTAFEHFSPDLKHQLIAHESTRFFAYRTPTWEGNPVRLDVYGQRLNGVIDATRTLDPRYPVWSPINTDLYRQYLQDSHVDGPDVKAQDALARQVVDLLYTVQNNLFCGGESAVGENHPRVVEKAVPLLAVIVLHFLHSADPGA